MSSMNRISKFVGKADVVTETYIDGEGPVFAILPSYDRDSGEDCDDVTGRLVRADWKGLRPQLRGIAGSKGPMTGVSFHELANEIAAVIGDLGDGRAVLLGHAFGHAVSRIVATDHPELVKSVILAASQASNVPADITKAPLDFRRTECARGQPTCCAACVSTALRRGRRAGRPWRRPERSDRGNGRAAWD